MVVTGLVEGGRDSIPPAQVVCSLRHVTRSKNGGGIYLNRRWNQRSVHPCVQIAENKNRKCLEADAAQLQPGEKNDFISEGEEASLPAVVLSTSDDLPTTKSPIVGSWSYQSPALDRVELEDSALLLISQEESPALTVTDKNNVVDDALERPRPKKDR